jgi:carbon-monoxide dehydrogenase small subunit
MKKITVKMEVNGKNVEKEIDPRMLLATFVRDELKLTGTHIGCDTTNCGACTLLLDGKAVKSCTVLAASASGKKVVTIEGISKDGTMHPVQKAFIEKHGLQCGFCTPGMIMTSYWLLGKGKKLSREEIRKYLSGNLCRCTGYQGIVDSVEYAAELMESEKAKEKARNR